MYSVSKRHSKSQVFARHIVELALSEYNVSVLSLTRGALDKLADEVLSRYPLVCDIRFRSMSICRILSYQRYCQRQEFARRLHREWLL